jgi:hypothetical protein
MTDKTNRPPEAIDWSTGRPADPSNPDQVKSNEPGDRPAVLPRPATSPTVESLDHFAGVKPRPRPR